MAGLLNSVYVALVFVVAVVGAFGVMTATQDVATEADRRLGMAIAGVVTLFVIGAAVPLVM